MSLSQQERTYRRKLVENGLSLPDSTSKRRGISVPGVRGAVPRFIERDAQIAALRSRGVSWADIATQVGTTVRAAKHGAQAHRRRRHR